ncbi:type II secretion system F family protein [Candidatus Micrarchaeota archaeon]|nr:type II secretion system F family protein [Candidatus Micrarchaeota archaeon]MBU1929991.1 type II secretion system F family protein [Candidatus Micrarchaeota archaeon]
MAKDEFKELDSETVDRIVNRMKKKYKEEGTEFETGKGKLEELRGIISTGKHPMQFQQIEELTEAPSPWIRRLGRLYLRLRSPLRPVGRFIASLPPAKTLNFYLYSANMRYSLRQYLALTTSVTAVSFVTGLLFGLLISFLLRLPVLGQIIITIIIALLFAVFAAFLMLLLPQSKAQQRGKEVTRELPFALRHMAAELKAGIGLYRTIQIIASADYGSLSEEFARTITEIEEGTEAKDALRNMAMRVQSKGLRNAVMHVVRAMKTGGNLSDVMNEIAEDISVEQRNEIREFAEKMNFFGVLFIFAGIVLPSLIVTLGGIRAAPLPLQIEIPVTPTTLAIMFFAIMPIILGILLLYLKAIQPR